MNRLILLVCVLSSCAPMPHAYPVRVDNPYVDMVIFTNADNVHVLCESPKAHYGCYIRSSKTIVIRDDVQGPDELYDTWRHELCHAITDKSVDECHELF